MSKASVFLNLSFPQLSNEEVMLVCNAKLGNTQQGRAVELSGHK